MTPPISRRMQLWKTGQKRIGSPETVPIRLRLFELLSGAYCSNQEYRLSQELYVDFAVQVQHLPLETFKQFLTRYGTP